MKLIAKAKIDNLFKDKDMTDKETGVVKPAKWKIQTFNEIDTEHGTKRELVNISITNEFYEKNKDKLKLGEILDIPVKVWVSGNKNGLYGV